MSKSEKHRASYRPARNKNEVINIGLDEVSAIARQHTAQAIRTLVFISENAQGEMARIAAARALLEYGHGRPPVQVDVNAAGRVDHIVYRSEAEFREALLERGIPARLLPPPVLEGPESEAIAPERTPESSEDEHEPADSTPIHK
jgi:hypothetical protein